MNMVTHIVGGGIGIIALVLCLIKAVLKQDTLGVVGACIYGGTMIILYAVSSIYHGLRPSTGKKVMQILDHCAIYFLIAGTYTPLMLSAFAPKYPLLGFCVLVAQWGLCALATTLTAIDLRRYRVLSMICYIGMGWGVIFFIPQTIAVLSLPGFYWLLSGGIAYTVGAILYGVGVKMRWMHSVFHIFVVIGSFLQFIAVLFYAI